MLFRLHMTIDNAIHAYKQFSEYVFSEKKFFFQEGTYKTSRLEQAIVGLLSQQLRISEAEAREVHMWDEDAPKW